jgi:hemoglobin
MKSLSKCVLVVVLSLFFVASINQLANSQAKPLYDRLGGKTAISAVVDQFVSNVAADTRVNAMFANVNIPHFKQCLVDQICQATGGPCKYTCRSMKDAHAGLGCTNDNFSAIVEDLVAALNKFNVGKTEQDELLAILSPLQKDIVQK